MINRFKIIIISSLFALALTSCDQREPETTVNINLEKAYSPNDTTETNELILAKDPEFDIDRFTTLVDSLLTSIDGSKIELNYKIDTLVLEKISNRSSFYALFSSPTPVVKRYSFDPGKGKRVFNLWLVEATYIDSGSTNSAFSELHNQTGKVVEGKDHSPGLTYTNDYVIKMNKRIYWLNSGCVYAFSNHQKMNGFLRQSLLHKNITDSIHCQCGQPKCSL